MMRLFSVHVISLVVVAMFQTAALGSTVRIKDVVDIQGARDNQLLGYGLVVGLNGTGDSLRNSPFTEASIKSMLDQLGIGRTNNDFRTKNVAAVLVTAKLPAYANKGTRIDVSVSSLGDASSLRGGTLVFTALYGGDGEIYASAQGALVVSGFSVEGEAAEADANTPTAARVPNGAIIEKPAPGNLNDEDFMILQLSNPDFNTAVAIVDRINEFTLTHYNRAMAREVDHRSVVVEVPHSVSITRFFASFSRLTIRPDTTAKIIVDERTGTVIIGADVKISKVAITHGGLTVAVEEFPETSQPQPFSDGVTVVESNTRLTINEPDASLGIVNGPDLNELVKGLNMMGAKPSNIIAILQGIKSAGALQADLVVQ